MEQSIFDFLTYLHDIKHASKNTIQAYHNDLKKFQLFMEKSNVTMVTQISETNLNSFVLSLEKDGLSPASVSRNIASLKSFFLYLLKHGKIKADPSERIKQPKVVKKAPQIIDIKIINQLLQQPDGTTEKGLRDKAMLELLYATGIKVSELISLKFKDINLKGQYIVCGDRIERCIPIGKKAVEALNNHIEHRRKKAEISNEDYLFQNTSGNKLSRQGFWKILKSYAKLVGIEEINPNIIRHSFAAHLIKNGADIVSVQEFLGHADVSTTQLYMEQNHKNTREVYMKTHPRA